MDHGAHHGWNVCDRIPPSDVANRSRTQRRRSRPADRPASRSLFDAEVKPGWDIDGNANGGYLLAIAGRAMAEAVGSPAAHADGALPQAGPAGPCEVEVTTVRAGRRLATATAQPADGWHRDHPPARHVRRADAGRPDAHAGGAGRSAALRGLRRAAAPDRRAEAGDVRAAADPHAAGGRRVPHRPADRRGARSMGGSRSPTRNRSTRSPCCSSPTRSRRRCSTPSCRWRGCRRSS